MKATLDIPDQLYRQVKARSALEGRPVRAVAVQLFQNWLDAPPEKPQMSSKATPQPSATPWLAITSRYIKPGMSHDMASIRNAISSGWAAEAKTTSEEQTEL